MEIPNQIIGADLQVGPVITVQLTGLVQITGRRDTPDHQVLDQDHQVFQGHQAHHGHQDFRDPVVQADHQEADPVGQDEADAIKNIKSSIIIS